MSGKEREPIGIKTSEFKVRAVAAPWWGGVEFLVRSEGAVGVLVMENVDDNVACDPTFRLSREAAQVLMDDLWNSGMRPTEGAGSAGAFRAVENHVSDLRKIVFKQMGIE